MNKLYMMIGLPASGKSTIAQELSKSEGAIIVSSDEIRKELLGDINDQSQNAKVFEEVEKRIKEGLLKDNVIYDATNINYKKRMAFLQKINKMKVEKIAVLIATPYEECLERNNNRERKVPEEVIKRMYHSFYIPQYYEGFDYIQIKYTSDYKFLLSNLKDIGQDNPHHSLTVINHCLKTYDIIRNMKKNKGGIKWNNLEGAGLLHDIGKLKTKTFINMKGEMTDVAHFYNHEKVSAYDTLFHLSVIGDDGDLEMIKLIQWHMLLHQNLSDKTKIKYKNMLGEDVWRDLEILHKADCEAM